MITFILGVTGCNETLDSLFSDGISEGEQVMFTTSLPSAPATRGTQEEYEEEMKMFQAVNKAYEFTIDMYADGKVVGTGLYSRDTLKTDGTLSPVADETLQVRRPSQLFRILRRTGCNRIVWKAMAMCSCGMKTTRNPPTTWMP